MTKKKKKKHVGAVFNTMHVVQ